MREQALICSPHPTDKALCFGRRLGDRTCTSASAVKSKDRRADCHGNAPPLSLKYTLCLPSSMRGLGGGKTATANCSCWNYVHKKTRTKEGRMPLTATSVRPSDARRRLAFLLSAALYIQKKNRPSFSRRARNPYSLLNNLRSCISRASLSWRYSATRAFHRRRHSFQACSPRLSQTFRTLYRLCWAIRTSSRTCQLSSRDWSAF